MQIPHFHTKSRVELNGSLATASGLHLVSTGTPTDGIIGVSALSLALGLSAHLHKNRKKRKKKQSLSPCFHPLRADNAGGFRHVQVQGHRRCPTFIFTQHFTLSDLIRLSLEKN